MRCKTVLWAVALVLLLCVCDSAPAACLARQSANLTSKCSFSVSSNAKDRKYLFDGKHGTSWTATETNDQYVEIILPKKSQIAGIYIMWNAVPKGWTLDATEDGVEWQECDVSDAGDFINAYVPLVDEYTKLRINSAGKWKLSVAEIKVFGTGELPQDVQIWKPSPVKADLMVIPAHPDDEHLYFGGTLPYYAGQLGKQTVVVYMTSSPMIRKFEALDGLWQVGVREYPVFLPLANKYSSTLEDAELAWDGLDNTVKLLVEQLRRFKPDVVVTHDLDGEYGHGAHKLTALAATMAIKASADKREYAASAKAFGVWQVQKCYLHLYPQNELKMNWRIELQAFNGRTALEMAKEGYEMHASQHFRDRPVADSGHDDNSLFGLFYSSVGPDENKDDFFENVLQPVELEPQQTTPASAAGTSPSPAADEIEAAAPVYTAPPRQETKSDLVPALLWIACALFLSCLLFISLQPQGKHSKGYIRMRRLTEQKK